MKSENSAGSSTRKKSTLEEEIAKTSEKLRKLQEQHREQVRKDRERNQRAVMELIKSEKLDTVDAEQWKAVMPKLRDLLFPAAHANGVKPASGARSAAVAPPAANPEASQAG